MITRIVLYCALWSVFYIFISGADRFNSTTGKDGVPSPGFTSMRQCKKYYNLSVPEEFIFPKTQEEWNDRNGEPLSRILGGGGEDALPKQLPFMAALGYEVGDRIEYICGGTLISERYVLTAAHCIYSRIWGSVKYIRLGDLNLASSADNDWVQLFQADEVQIHPNYTYPVKYHDIALIKLNKPANLTEYVFPACLEPFETNIIADEYYAAGWGLLGHGEDKSDHLQVMTLYYYSKKQCQQFYRPDFTIPEGLKSELHICVGTHSGKIVDTCEGDSGGPMTYKFPRSLLDKGYFLSGITSFGKFCGLAHIPAVYTRVSYYIEWIEKIVWPEEFRKSVKSDIIYFPDS